MLFTILRVAASDIERRGVIRISLKTMEPSLFDRENKVEKRAENINYFDFSQMLVCKVDFKPACSSSMPRESLTDIGLKSIMLNQDKEK